MSQEASFKEPTFDGDLLAQCVQPLNLGEETDTPALLQLAENNSVVASEEYSRLVAQCVQPLNLCEENETSVVENSETVADEEASRLRIATPVGDANDLLPQTSDVTADENSTVVANDPAVEISDLEHPFRPEKRQLSPTRETASPRAKRQKLNDLNGNEAPEDEGAVPSTLQIVEEECEEESVGAIASQCLQPPSDVTTLANSSINVAAEMSEDLPISHENLPLKETLPMEATGSNLEDLNESAVILHIEEEECEEETVEVDDSLDGLLQLFQQYQMGCATIIETPFDGVESASEPVEPENVCKDQVVVEAAVGGTVQSTQEKPTFTKRDLSILKKLHPEKFK